MAINTEASVKSNSGFVNINKSDLIDFADKHIITESFIDNIINTRKFCDHGSSLDDAYELFEDFENEFPNALQDDSVLRDFLWFWLPFRIKYIANEMFSEFQYYRTIHREMIIDDYELNRIKSIQYNSVEVFELGVYWSTSPSTIAYNGDTTKNNYILISADLNIDAIDWFGTLESRIDYLNGDQEQEIKLNEYAQIDFLIKKIDYNTNKQS